MPLDANGIHQYEESETGVSPFSTFLNRLASSVSTKIGPLLIDTGWVTIPLKAGFVGTLVGRLKGNTVTIRGLVTPNTNWGGGLSDNQIVDACPVNLRPVAAVVNICASQSPSDATYFRVTSNGATVSVRSPTGGGYTPGVYINYTYSRD